MGTEAVWVPLVMSAVATGASIYNTNQTAKKADNTAAAGIRQQSKNQQETAARINKSLQFAQQSKPDEAKATAEAQYMNQINRKKGQANAQLGQRKTMGSAFNEAAAGAEQNVLTGASQDAGLMARIDAPQLQRQNEQFAYGNLGMDLDVSGRNVQQDEFMNRLALSRIRRNPYLDAGAAALNGGARGYGGGG
jgi:hypothetical protein